VPCITRCVALSALGVALMLSAACRTPTADGAEPATESAAVAVTLAEAVERPVTRYLRVTGTLIAQEEASVAAEIAGRVVATPIERGSLVGSGDSLVRILSTEVDAQASEAQANAAQIEARLGTAGGAAFDVERVAEVANARAAYELAMSEFERMRQLQERQLVSRSEFDQRKAQTEAARRQYEMARNAAEQQYQALIGARARLDLARKAVADTVVRAPFAGVVGERLVSVGDYVTRGTKVATVMRVNPLRVELTVPQQYIATIVEGRPVTLDVDAHPGESFTGTVRYVSPLVKSDSRSLVVEAVVDNRDGRLKPGFFATARIEQAARTPGVLVPAAAIRTVAGTARVYVEHDGRAEERIVTIGDTAGDLVEVTAGVEAGERVVVIGSDRVGDGSRLAIGR
jgi:RND family efflux transporter MFP subunit